jgi:hypothetical protein
MLGAAGVETNPRRRDAAELRHLLTKLESWAGWTARDEIDWDELEAVEAFMQELTGMGVLLGSITHSTWARLAELHDESEE